MNRIHYLGYGSNLHPARLLRRVPSTELVATVTIPGFELVFNKESEDGSGKCTLCPADGDAVVYAAIFSLDPRDKSKLDKVEGLGIGYEEMLLDLPPFGMVFCYLAKADCLNNKLQPFTWYKRYVQLGAKYHDFPEYYISNIDATVAVDDPDSNRANRKHKETETWD